MRDINYEAFLRDRKKLEKEYQECIVAYADGKLIAIGKDSDELLDKISDEYRYRSLLIKEIPEIEISFHRPCCILED